MGLLQTKKRERIGQENDDGDVATKIPKTDGSAVDTCVKDMTENKMKDFDKNEGLSSVEGLSAVCRESGKKFFSGKPVPILTVSNALPSSGKPFNFQESVKSKNLELETLAKNPTQTQSPCSITEISNVNKQTTNSVESNTNDVTIATKIEHPKLEEDKKPLGDGCERIKVALTKLKSKGEYWNKESKELVKSIGDCYWDFPESREKLSRVFRQHGGAGLCVTMINNLSRHGLFKTTAAWFTAYYAYTLCWNFSDISLELCRSFGEVGMIRICLTNIAHEPYRKNIRQKNILYLVKASLNILHNLAKEPSNRQYFRKDKAVDKIKYFMNSDQYLKSIAMMTLAYIIEEHENHLISDHSAIEFIAKLLRDALCNQTGRAEGFSCMELAQGLGHLAVNDRNKTKIDSAGALPLLIEMLDRSEPTEQAAAANALWNLTFDDCVRKKIKDNENCILALQQLSRSENDLVKSAANGALWVIGRDDRPPTRRYSSRSGKFVQPHIMISYQWGSQETVLRIANDLKEAGYNVWIDVEYMGGSTLEAMAEAVENAAVVLVCASQKYKESPNCRTEAEYTYQLHKDVVPLLMESYYKPDGWLGMLMGVKLYIDFSGSYQYDDQVKKLIKELGERGKKVVSMTEETSPVTKKFTTVGSVPMLNYHNVVCWNSQDVQNWATEIGLESCRDQLSEYNGKLLIQLQKLRQEAPEFFYNSLKQDLKLTKLVDILKFTEALDSLL
ncbi:uncharacterized protein [Ptychodera flava]|uniref:uncharacterized protein isoform X2 n=1 Tax=Ptychodera flava TaxID=63121 RepID=UPI00396AABA1